MQRPYSSEAGYSLVEVLVALVLMMIVLLPASQWLGRQLSDSSNRDRIAAVQLAEAAIETCLIEQDFTSQSDSRTIAGRDYAVIRHASEPSFHLVIITIEVRRHDKLLAVLSASQYRVSADKGQGVL